MNKLRASIFGSAGIAIIALGVFAWKYEEWIVIPKARAPILDYLKDPQSAQFRNERMIGSRVLCGEVNGKNSMGGYVGFKRYILAGVEANYIEGDGPIGKWSTPDFLQRLTEENNILQRVVELRKQIPEYPAPSDSQRTEEATKAVFELRWQENCGTGKMS